MTKNVMTQKDRFQLQKLLETVLEENGELYDYKPGWSDVRVAQERALTISRVRNTRTRTFGVLYRQADEPSGTTRIASLEARVLELQVQMAEVLETLTLENGNLFVTQKSNGEIQDAT